MIKKQEESVGFLFEMDKKIGTSGSGNFGHGGIIGHRGGSTPSGGSGKEWTGKVKLASEISGKIPIDRDGKPIPVKIKTVYHVTKRESVASILSGGFSLDLIQPRWENDYAISFNATSPKKAMAYFTSTGGKFDSQKYALLEVAVKGRFWGEHDGVNVGYASGAKDYTRRVIASGLDGNLQPGGTLFLYNTKSISQIKEASV